ncbi:voltage-gated potassium channel [Desulfofundulus luciae]|uniref:Voltage-gated potassium channel n=1 Tax=Desulfofundulus luciae TaxID=74702 RepID=A0ABU0B443_9FIRM|nr:potassium channel protein [Desulfofundulus luciae]MDQ0287035.1 voltage-gated potassium channel [Desulfofundulus luciae]
MRRPKHTSSSHAGSDERIVAGALRFLAYISALETVIFVMGVLLLTRFEHLSPFEAFYLAIITLTTVGYGDYYPVSEPGRLVALVLAVTGVGYQWLSLSTVVAILVEGHIIRFLGEKQMERKIARLKNHVIICGLGRAGMSAVRQLEREGVPFVGIDLNERQVESLREHGHLAIPADATEDETLKAAGVERARSLIAALPHDPDNILIAMAAKDLNPSIRVVARADRPENIKRLKRAGADWVTAVGVPGGTRLALAALKPAAVDFVSSILEHRNTDYKPEELLIDESSPLAGCSIRESRLKEDYGAQVLAIIRENATIVNPEATEKIQPGDMIIVFGDIEKLAPLAFG